MIEEIGKSCFKKTDNENDEEVAASDPPQVFNVIIDKLESGK